MKCFLFRQRKYLYVLSSADTDSSVFEGSFECLLKPVATFLIFNLFFYINEFVFLL